MKKGFKIFLAVVLAIGFLSLGTIALATYGISKHFTDAADEISGFFSKQKTIIDNEIEQAELNDLLDDVGITTVTKQVKDNVENNITNIVIFGVDTYDMSNFHKSRSDSIVVLSLNKGNKKMKLSSILRDTLVYIPAKDDFNRINSALVYEKTTHDAVRIIEDTLATRIDNYLIINFQTVIKLIEGFGGVGVHINSDEVKWLNDILKNINAEDNLNKKSPYIENEGYQVLDGKQTLAYIRIRKEGGDFARVRRQKEVIEYLYHKILNTDKSTIINMLSMLKEETKNNFSLFEMINLIMSIKNIGGGGIETITLPKSGSYELGTYKKMSVIIPKKGQIAKDFNDFIIE